MLSGEDTLSFTQNIVAWLLKLNR